MEEQSIASTMKKNPGLFLRNGMSPAESVAVSILETMLTDRISPVIMRKVDDKILIGADEDWIEPYYPNYVFDKFIPLYDMANTFRGEALLNLIDRYWLIKNGVVVSGSAEESSAIVGLGVAYFVVVLQN
jgi:hypothetical protein